VFLPLFVFLIFVVSLGVCLSACSFFVVCLKEKADQHTRKETTKITKENSTGKTQMETYCVLEAFFPGGKADGA
jgi:sulfite exporter TauE/SafE